MYDPDAYDANSPGQRRDARVLLPYITDQMTWSSSEVVLDFGCGSGYVTKNILLPLVLDTDPSGPHIYALDVSKKMIDFASVKYPSPNITYIQGDILEEKFKMPCKFTKIFSSHVLHWISDQEKALEIFYTSLDVNGEIGLFFLGGFSFFDIYGLMAKNPKWSTYLADYRKFVPVTHTDPEKGTQNLYQILERIGFSIQECARVEQKYTFDSIEAMIDVIFAVNPFIPQIPPKLLNEYKEDFRVAFIACVHGSVTEDGFEADHSVIVIRAKKDEKHIKERQQACLTPTDKIVCST